MKGRTQSQERYKAALLDWNREQSKFDHDMTSVLRGMQYNERARLQTFADCLSKWALFGMSLSTNRNDKLQVLAQAMSRVNPVC